MGWKHVRPDLMTGRSRRLRKCNDLVGWNLIPRHPSTNRRDFRAHEARNVSYATRVFDHLLYASHIVNMRNANVAVKWSLCDMRELSGYGRKQIVFLPTMSFMTDQAIADRLRQARIAAGYDSPTDAAKALGVPYQTYYAHEIGRRKIGNDTLMRYAKKFRTTAAVLLGEKPSPVSAPPARPSADPAEEVAAHIQEALEVANLGADRFAELLELLSEIYDEPLDVAPGQSQDQARAVLLRSHIRRFLKSKAPKDG